MQVHQLRRHDNFAPALIESVSVRWSALNDGRLMLRYRVDGCAKLVVPDFRGKGRGDDLWKTTCFELFLHDGGGRYREFNFSPSQQWAAYCFSGYRQNREDFEPRLAPEIKAERGEKTFMLTVFLSREESLGVDRAALSAVLEEEGRRPSYWALTHNKLEPDFHDPACFVLPLGAGGVP